MTKEPFESNGQQCSRTEEKTEDRALHRSEYTGLVKCGTTDKWPTSAFHNRNTRDFDESVNVTNVFSEIIDENKLTSWFCCATDKTSFLSPVFSNKAANTTSSDSRSST